MTFTKSFFFVLLFLSTDVFGQNDHRLSPAEQTQMPSYLNAARNASLLPSNPPVSPVRAMAEWEEITALTITWTGFTAILTEVVRAAQNDAFVFIVCSDSNNVKNILTTANVPLQKVRYVIAGFNSIWCRDYGQWNVYTNDVDSLALIDWIYNRPRPSDDAVPSAIRNYTGLPMYAMVNQPYDLIHTGGNLMVDGRGTAFSSDLIIDENPTKTEAEIDTIMNQFMGISRYIKLNTLPYDVIHHIDMHIKLLDEETLLVGEYPPGTADGPQIEANLLYILSNFNSVFGTPYRVIRIPMPPDAMGLYPDNNGDYRTYTNSVFVNKTIIVPTYAEQYDTTAIRIYSEAMPGYTIAPVNCNSIIPSLGAIHCITKEVGAFDPLLISHQPLRDTYVSSGTYPGRAMVKHRSGILSAVLHFRTDTTLPYQTISMTPVAGDPDFWEFQMPAQPPGSGVYYFIEAISNTGKIQSRPMTAPAGYWKFDVLLNNEINSPSISGTILSKPFPNPSRGITCIPVYTDKNSDVKIALRNILSSQTTLIYEGKNSGEKKYFVNTSGFAAGIYILEMIADGNYYNEKLIVR